jgi:hypothetical protein
MANAQGNPIIVVNTFNSIIEANIVKAKLDAYGIPCFLSEEHLTSLTTHILSGGVRLHIFEEDLPKVKEILTIEWVQKTDEDDLVHCPKCRSKRILSTPKRLLNPAFIVKFLLQLSKKHYCLDCDTEFDL